MTSIYGIERARCSVQRRGSVIALLAGAILLQGTASAQSWSGSNPVYTTTSGASVGIGTTNPLATLDLGAAAGPRFLLYGSGGTTGYLSGIGINLGQTPNSMGFFLGHNANCSIDVANVSEAFPYTSGYTSKFTMLNNGNVGIGTTNPVHPLQVAGIVGAEEIIVSATGADYVFDPGYRLQPLSEVAEYVKENRHLPEIPSAAEVEANGVSLGEMQSKLLAKIEELTLHMIRAEERNSRLEQQNQDLQGRIARLESHDATAGVSLDQPVAEKRTLGNSSGRR